MSIELSIAPTRAEFISPAGLAQAWRMGQAGTELTAHRLLAGVRESPPANQPMAINASYVIEFSDGIEVSLLISDNAAMGCDEEGEIAEFGDTRPYVDLIALWRAVGYTYDVLLSGGAYGKPSIHRMEQLAGIIAGLVQGYVLVLDPWYSRPRGLYAPGTFP